MESLMMGGTTPPDTSKQEAQARGIAAQLIKKSGSVIGAFNEFNEQSQTRLEAGNTPNALFPTVAGIFSQIVPIAENLEKLESVKGVVKNEVLNNLIYDSAMQINSYLEEGVIELPEVENLSMEDEIIEYEQSLIKIFNLVPNTKNDKKRSDLLHVADLLTQTIEQAKSRNAVV